MYNLSNLNDYEFEILAKDIMKKNLILNYTDFRQEEMEGLI